MHIAHVSQMLIASAVFFALFVRLFHRFAYQNLFEKKEKMRKTNGIRRTLYVYLRIQVSGMDLRCIFKCFRKKTFTNQAKAIKCKNDAVHSSFSSFRWILSQSCELSQQI